MSSISGEAVPDLWLTECITKLMGGALQCDIVFLRSEGCIFPNDPRLQRWQQLLSMMACMAFRHVNHVASMYQLLRWSCCRKVGKSAQHAIHSLSNEALASNEAFANMSERVREAKHVRWSSIAFPTSARRSLHCRAM